MRKVIAACGVALVALIGAVPAQAALTTVNVRIEGKAETLFEGPVATEPHGVRASSDRIAGGKLRRCDGIDVNDPWNTLPGVTPTAVSADAMSLLGETFDGQWYKQYEDYFITRWGPDEQDIANSAYWGILVDDVFTNVGGCQYQLHGGDEVLWVYDAFKNRPTLALFPQTPRYEAGPRPRTVTVAAGVPVPVEVVSYSDDEEDTPPAGPTRAGSNPLASAAVAPVATNAKGFERVETAGAGVQTTNSEGKASVTYSPTEPGWHRIKATVGIPGSESVIRSNRLDVCVTGGSGTPSELEGARTCAETPLADQVRVAPGTVGELFDENETAPSKTAPATGSTEPLRITTPRVARGKIAAGKVTVSWKVLNAGPGIKKWTVSSLTVGEKHARWVARASGATKTKAMLRLPQGHTYKLRFAITDKTGETSTLSLGKVKVPEARRPHHR
jgi:hypothetical protein